MARTLFIVLGLALGVAAQSGPTPPDQLLTRLAIDTAPDGDVPPIEIAIEGVKQFTVYDRFRLVSVAARHALAGARPLDPARPPSELLAPRVIVLAFARAPMSGDPAQPQGVRINGRSGKRLKPEEVRSLLPGVAVPADTVAVSFSIAGLKPSDRISIVFTERAEMMSRPPGGGVPGSMTPGTFTAPVRFTTPETLETAVAAVPAGVTLQQPRVDVPVEGVLDLTGRIRFARALGGPSELHAAAVEAVSKWRYTPARMFGVPVPLVMQATVPFTR